MLLFSSVPKSPTASIKLDKYFILDPIARSYENCNIECNLQNKNSSLSSIHSIDDFNEAKEYCQTANNITAKTPCWIGLNDNDAESEWKWDDNTNFDYGTNISGGIFPWFEGNNNSPPKPIIDASENCVQIASSRNYKWDDKLCSQQKLCLCYKPSLLCLSETNWTTIDTNYIDEMNRCDFRLEKNGERVITAQQWYNNDNQLWIDFMFSLEYDAQNDFGNGGIIIYNDKNGSFCQYYYVYINTIKNPLYQGIFLKYGTRVINSEPLKINLTVNATNYYLLSVRITNGNQFNIYLNNVLHISYTDNDNNNSLSNGNSGFIGIKTEYIYSLHAKYLYVSGNSLHVSLENILNTSTDCTKPTGDPTEMSLPTQITSLVPTQKLSLQPTQNPSSIPTQIGSDGIIITVIFQYELSVNDSMIISNVLQNITKLVIIDSISNISISCLNSKGNSAVSQETIINITITVCDKYSNAANDILDVVSDTKTQSDIIVSLNQQIDVNTNKILVSDIILIGTTNILNPSVSPTKNVESDGTTSQKEEDETFIVLLIVGISLLCCILIFCGFIAFKIKKEKKTRSEQGIAITMRSNNDTATRNIRIYSASDVVTDNDNNNESVINDNNLTKYENNESVQETATDHVNSEAIINGYDSMEFIKEIKDVQQLSDIDIDIKGHQTKLFVEIKRLEIDNNNNNENSIIKNSYDEEGYQQHITYPTSQESNDGTCDTNAVTSGNYDGDIQTSGNNEEIHADIADDEFVIH